MLDRDYGHAEIRRISDPLKEEYAALKGLASADELKTSGPLKEVYRAEMIKFGEDIREKDYGYFCRKAIQHLPDSVQFLIISDCRRPSDLAYFLGTFTNVYVIQIRANLETRIQRGFVYCPDIDEAESECALSDYQDTHAAIDNSNDSSITVADRFDAILKQLL